MQLGMAAGAGDEAGGLGLLARGEQTTDRTPRDVPAGRQAILARGIRLVVIERPAKDLRRSGMSRGHALDAEQMLLQPEAVAGVAHQIASAADDAMARYDDRQRIVAQRLGDRAHGRRLAELLRDAPVRCDRAVGHGGRGLQDRALEVAARIVQVERPVEPRAPALDVLEQLTPEAIETAGVLAALHAGQAEEP